MEEHQGSWPNKEDSAVGLALTQPCWGSKRLDAAGQAPSRALVRRMASLRWQAALHSNPSQRFCPFSPLHSSKRGSSRRVSPPNRHGFFLQILLLLLFKLWSVQLQSQEERRDYPACLQQAAGTELAFVLIIGLRRGQKRCCPRARSLCAEEHVWWIFPIKTNRRMTIICRSHWKRCWFPQRLYYRTPAQSSLHLMPHGRHLSFHPLAGGDLSEQAPLSGCCFHNEIWASLFLPGNVLNPAQPLSS